jgi:hypothetical protein
MSCVTVTVLECSKSLDRSRYLVIYFVEFPLFLLITAVVIHDLIGLVGPLKIFPDTIFIKVREQYFYFSSKKSTPPSNIEICGVLDSLHLISVHVYV